MFLFKFQTAKSRYGSQIQYYSKLNKVVLRLGGATYIFLKPFWVTRIKNIFKLVRLAVIKRSCKLKKDN